MSNQAIRDAVDRICAEMEQHIGPHWLTSGGFRDTAKRLYPLPKPREIMVRGHRYRVHDFRLQVFSDTFRVWGDVATADALDAYNQLKALGFTVEE